jgi:hypothetical protein
VRWSGNVPVLRRVLPVGSRACLQRRLDIRARFDIVAQSELSNYPESRLRSVRAEDRLILVT